MEQSVFVNSSKSVCNTRKLVISYIGGQSIPMPNEIFIVKPCSTRAAFEGVLKHQAKLNLTDYSKRLRDKGYELIAITDYVIVAKRDYEFTIFPSGKVLVKDIDDPDLAKTLLQRLYGDLNLYER